ncbi:MAG TPA: flagellinolysin [Symbiobacteriaceae bacterium]|nr:flagellinolysin [Symbiobacteriaceae bacterium]
MSVNHVRGLSAMRVDPSPGLSPQTPQLGRASVQAGAAAAPNRLLADQVTFSRDALALNRLVRTWGALTFLFGGGAGSSQSGPGLVDFSSLRQALQEAQHNLAAMQTRQRVTDTLKTSVLRQAELLVEKYYGLKGDGTTVKVRYEEDMNNALASVSFRYDRQGRMAEPQLHINLSQFTPDTGPNGVNQHVIQNDRIIAHEMTHLIMGRNMDMRSLPDWFAEGTAEYIAGGAERVSISLRSLTPGQLLNRLAQRWEGDSDQYAASYLAVRYLDRATAGSGGLKAIMSRLKEGDSLGQAISRVSGGRFESTEAFLQAFIRGGEGEAFLRTIDLSGRDPGSVKAGPGSAVVADGGNRSGQPLSGFRLEWPSPLDGYRTVFGFGFTPAAAVHAAYRTQMQERSF